MVFFFFSTGGGAPLWLRHHCCFATTVALFNSLSLLNRNWRRDQKETAQEDTLQAIKHNSTKRIERKEGGEREERKKKS